MPVSEVKLAPNKVIQHARDIIKPGGWQCEWNNGKTSVCKLALTSWNAYLKHVLYHCQEECSQSKPPTFTCHLPRCNISSGGTLSSFQDLTRHVEQSHLGRGSQLQCPVKDCNLSFARHGMLESHFIETHHNLLNQTIQLPSELLHPSWLPFFPPPVNLPPLPAQVLPGTALIPPVLGSWKGPPQTPLLRPQASQLGSPKRKKQIPAASRDMEQEDEPREFFFEDLPKQLDKLQGNYTMDVEQDCLLHSVGPPVDIARPQPILDPNIFGYQMPAKSILYDAFVGRHLAEWASAADEEQEDSQATVTTVQHHLTTRQGIQPGSSSRVPSKVDN